MKNLINIFYGLLMILAFTTTGCIAENEPEGPSLTVGDNLPQFSVVMNDGQEITTSTLKGKVPIIVFFNTGCPDCQKELPVIQKLWEQYKNDPIVKIIPIAREESQDKIQKYWEANNLTLPFSPQENRAIYNLFAPSVIPRIYIANKKGIIIATYDDSDLPSLSSLISNINSALNP